LVLIFFYRITLKIYKLGDPLGFYSEYNDITKKIEELNKIISEEKDLMKKDICSLGGEDSDDDNDEEEEK
jgi:hypothetical protein